MCHSARERRRVQVERRCERSGAGRNLLIGAATVAGFQVGGNRSGQAGGRREYRTSVFQERESRNSRRIDNAKSAWNSGCGRLRSCCKIRRLNIREERSGNRSEAFVAGCTASKGLGRRVQRRRLGSGFTEQGARIRKECKGWFGGRSGCCTLARARTFWSRRDCRNGADVRRYTAVWCGEERAGLQIGHARQKPWNRGRSGTGNGRVGIPGEGRVVRQHRAGGRYCRLLRRIRKCVEHLVGHARQLCWRENAGSDASTRWQSRTFTGAHWSSHCYKCLLTCTHGIVLRPHLPAGQLHRR